MNKFLISIVFIFISLFSYGQGKVLNYLFDNNFTDTEGNYNGINKNNTTFTSSYKIQGSHAAAFADPSGSSRIITPGPIDFTSGPKSYSFGLLSHNTGGLRALVSNRTGVDQKGHTLLIDEINHRLIVLMDAGATDGSAYSANNSIPQATSVWVTVVLPDGNGDIARIYINGVRSGTDSVGIAGSGLNDTLAIGAFRNGTVSCYAYIDNFSLYDCELSNADVTNIYNARTSEYTEPCGSGGGAYLGLETFRNTTLINKFLKGDEIGYFRRQGFSEPLLTRVVFAEDFETLPTGGINRAQRSIWNLKDGFWDEADALVTTAPGHGNVLRLNFQSEEVSQPILNTVLLLDSIYHFLIVQYDLFVPSDFDYYNGGKTFMSLIGGPDPDIPYRGDTVGTGFNTLKMFQPGGNITWYDYTHNASGYGTTLSSVIQMPSSTHSGTSVLGKDYSWGYPYSFNANTPTGLWYAWPVRTEHNGTSWQFSSSGSLVSTITKGSWHTYTFYMYLKEGGHHDIEEVYKDGVCTFSKGDNRFRIIDNLNWGIEGLYLNAFYGGNADNPPTDQYWLVDNIVAYVISEDHPNFHSTPATIGSTIPLLSGSTKYLNSPAKPVANERYTQSSGTIHSHNKAFHYIPKDITVSKWISVAGATQYNLTATQYGYHNNCTNYYNNWIKIYRYNSGTPTLSDQYDCDSYTLHTTVLNCDSVRIDFYTGEGVEYNKETGYTFTYTTNGAGSGTNPIFPPASDMVAVKPTKDINAFSINESLGKGVNVVSIVPFGGTCTPQWTSAEYDSLAAGGFGHVRAVFFGFNETGGANYEIQPGVLANVKSIIDSFLIRGIKVVLDYHQPAFLLNPSQTNYDRFVSHWRQLADYFSEYSVHDLVFELTNEPLDDWYNWNIIANNAVAAIRQHSPELSRAIILSPALWAQVAGLPYLTLPNDDMLILSIHYYKPTTFTHQGMTGNEGAVGGHWYNVQPMVEEIDEYFTPLVTFASAHNIPINIGEFGVNKDYGTELADRASYVNYHTRYFEEQGWSWAYFDYDLDFGIYDGGYIPEMVDALNDPMPTLSTYTTTTVYQSNFVNTTGWSVVGDASLSVANGELVTTISNGGSVPNDIIVRYPVAFNKNIIYRVTYTIRSAATRSYMIEKTPYLEWSQYGLGTTNYTNVRSFTHYFTNYNGYIQFCIGGSNAPFYINNFKIETINIQ